MRISRTVVLFLSIAIVGASAGVASATGTGTGTANVIPGVGPKVYSTQVVGSYIPLKSSDTVVLTSPALAAGNYLVNFDVTLLLRPDTNVRCALQVNKSYIDNMSGAAGAGDSKFAPIYATDTEGYVVHIANAASIVRVVCSTGGSPSTGTTTGNVRMLTAVQLGTWTVRTI